MIISPTDAVKRGAASALTPGRSHAHKHKDDPLKETQKYLERQMDNTVRVELLKMRDFTCAGNGLYETKIIQKAANSCLKSSDFQIFLLEKRLG